MRTEFYLKDDDIVTHNDEGDTFYFILEGTVEIIVPDEEKGKMLDQINELNKTLHEMRIDLSNNLGAMLEKYNALDQKKKNMI